MPRGAACQPLETATIVSVVTGGCMCESVAGVGDLGF
jgi:hypothetical protein